MKLARIWCWLRGRHDRVTTWYEPWRPWDRVQVRRQVFDVCDCCGTTLREWYEEPRP